MTSGESGGETFSAAFAGAIEFDATKPDIRKPSIGKTGMSIHAGNHLRAGNNRRMKEK